MELPGTAATPLHPLECVSQVDERSEIGCVWHTPLHPLECVSPADVRVEIGCAWHTCFLDFLLGHIRCEAFQASGYAKFAGVACKISHCVTSALLSYASLRAMVMAIGNFEKALSQLHELVGINAIVAFITMVFYGSSQLFYSFTFSLMLLIIVGADLFRLPMRIKQPFFGGDTQYSRTVAVMVGTHFVLMTLAWVALIQVIGYNACSSSYGSPFEHLVPSYLQYIVCPRVLGFFTRHVSDKAAAAMTMMSQILHDGAGPRGPIWARVVACYRGLRTHHVTAGSTLNGWLLDSLVVGTLFDCFGNLSQLAFNGAFGTRQFLMSMTVCADQDWTPAGHTAISFAIVSRNIGWTSLTCIQSYILLGTLFRSKLTFERQLQQLIAREEEADSHDLSATTASLYFQAHPVQWYVGYVPINSATLATLGTTLGGLFVGRQFQRLFMWLDKQGQVP